MPATALIPKSIQSKGVDTLPAKRLAVAAESRSRATGSWLLLSSTSFPRSAQVRPSAALIQCWAELASGSRVPFFLR